MANNYTLFSECYKVTDAQKEIGKKLDKILGELVREGCSMSEVMADPDAAGDLLDLDEETLKFAMALPASVTARLDDAVEYAGICDFQADKDGLWFYSEEGGSVDYVAAILKSMLILTDDHDSVFTLTWSGTCSKPRCGEFGGGWFALSLDDEKWGNTWDDAAEAEKAMTKQGKKVA